jgi:ferredoxin-NADP reductase
MERTAVRRRLSWQAATVTSVTRETAAVCTIELDPPDWPGHRAGQHLDVRLTADDGYSAERSYSIASAPGEPVAITVERLDDGEVSPYLTQELRPGDDLELRGPIGGYFVWKESLGGPILLVGGGSGIVPLRAMLRHHRAVDSNVPARLLYSARTRDDLIYREELANYDTRITLTREKPEGWDGYTGRVNADLLTEVAWPPAEKPLAYICGPTGFVEGVSEALVALGHDAMRIRTERFGPTS